MKGILNLVLGGVLASVSAYSFADTAPTAMDKNWTCTTNASSSSVTTDQDADKQMANTPRSAADAYAFAAQNCRDCTKITCEAQTQ